ncbi:SPOR domain-containing protein [Methyloglobulus sp.]|uniref:SPOR domain-containing protein n=1 Tax=Methyloglobulus sp. TaxID=2518622 RepID=UPI0039898351
MDHELKQRLIGAVVVTALAAIFIPMLFDDPVDTSGKAVTELTIPQAPADAAPETAQNLPANKDQVLNRPETELSVTEFDEGSHANATGQGQTTNIPDGEQTEQSGMSDSGSDIPENEPSDDLTTKQAGQNKEPTLDTGMVEKVRQPEESQGNAVNTTEAAKEPEQGLETPAKGSVSKPVVPGKTKVKSVPSVEKTAEKTKAVAKTPKDTAKKSSSKLVRYSIQAGSFNKKENAQALVEKLRKQGMPASIVTKGDLYRVKIGPALDKNKAKEMKAKLDKQNIKSVLYSE